MQNLYIFFNAGAEDAEVRRKEGLNDNIKKLSKKQCYEKNEINIFYYVSDFCFITPCAKPAAKRRL